MGAAGFHSEEFPLQPSSKKRRVEFKFDERSIDTGAPLNEKGYVPVVVHDESGAEKTVLIPKV